MKPDNIYLPGRDISRAKLGDFGLVDTLDRMTNTTEVGMVLGTPYYMSPEQASGKARSAASDGWALGVVLFECAYGRVPFDGENIIEVFARMMMSEPTFQPLEGGLDRVLRRALAKEPADRFASMQEFAEALATGSADFIDHLADTDPGMRLAGPLHAHRSDLADTDTVDSPSSLAPDPSAGPRPSDTGQSMEGGHDDPAPHDTTEPSDTEATKTPAPTEPSKTPTTNSDAREPAGWTRVFAPPWRRSTGLIIVFILVEGVAIVVAPVIGGAAAQRVVIKAAIVLTAGVLAAALVHRLLSHVERGDDASDSLADDAEAVQQRTKVASVLSRSLAVTLDSLLTKSAADPSIDLRRVSLAMAIEDFQSAKDRDDQREALDRAIALADKLREQVQHRVRPWYVRHKEALTLSTALIAAAAALVTSVAGALK